MDTDSSQELLPDIDARGRDIIRQMDSAGIDKSVIFLGDYGLLLGEGTFSVDAENQFTANLASRSQGRLIPFVGVDPRRDGAERLVHRAVEEWGARGIKLHPGSGFKPSDPECMPLFAYAGTQGIPVAVHTGPMASPLLSETARPVYLDTVAARYPETTIIMLHTGQQCWWEEALNVAFWKPNVFLELSMWQWTFQYDPGIFIHAIAKMKHFIGLERVLFGSDFPGLDKVMTLDDWVRVFVDLPALAEKHGASVTPHESRALLGGNAARLLKLNND